MSARDTSAITECSFAWPRQRPPRRERRSRGHYAYWCAVEPRGDVVGAVLVEDSEVLARHEAEVRQQDGVRRRDQWVVRVDRFGVVHVESRAGDRAAM